MADIAHLAEDDVHADEASKRSDNRRGDDAAHEELVLEGLEHQAVGPILWRARELRPIWWGVSATSVMP